MQLNIILIPFANLACMLAGGGEGMFARGKVLKADDELKQRSRAENDEATPRA